MQCKQQVQGFLDQFLIFEEAVPMNSNVNMLISRLRQSYSSCSINILGSSIQIIGARTAVRKIVGEIRRQQEE